MGEDNKENTFKILIATDIHLGYAEKDRIREQDSFRTFAEILEHAKQNDVDFVLLGGDLFHDAKPSPYCITKCLELLRRYCLGDKPVSIEFLSDQSCNFQHLFNPIVNYEDPNLNVAIPVFSIHGNHDDPTGTKEVSALDLVATTGLINYFGRWKDLSKVEIKPILLRKGTTKLALYGLSHIRDERLGRLFRDRKIIMSQPKSEGWYNIFVLHQNRVPHGAKNFIPENALPDFLDLVVWGHEHQCIMEPEFANNTSILQPGSSVATSLAEGESAPKHVVLLEVCGREATRTPIPLKTVRPFVFDELILVDPKSRDYQLDNPKQQAIKHVERKINAMIAEANEAFERPQMQPLIRLKVFYHDARQEFNPIKVGQHFADRVANPEDVIRLNSLKARSARGGKRFNDDDEELDQFINTEEWATSVEKVLEKYYEDNNKKHSMKVLSVKGMTEAVTRYVQKGDTDILSIVIDKQTKKTVEKLMEIDPAENEMEKVLESLLNERLQASEALKEKEEVIMETVEIPDDEEIPQRPISPKVEQQDSLDMCLLSSDDEMIGSISLAPVKRGRGRGRGQRGASKAASTSTSRGRPRGRPRGSRGSRGASANSSYMQLDSN